MAAPARAAAFTALRAIAAGRIDLGEALQRARTPLSDPRDRALTTELVTGTLRWRGAIDYQLQQRSRKPLDKLDAEVLDALRLGAYQLLYLERVPASAVVNDAVGLVRKAGLASAAGFANAILRRLARERGALTWPDRSDPIEHLAVVHSHPRWLVARWVARAGVEEAERWLRFNNQPPALTLAVNRQRASREALAAALAGEGIETTPTVLAPHGLIVTAGRALTAEAFRSGACVVQDEASQLIPELVAAVPGDTVLDACAAPGGKTVALAAQCAPSGRVVAADVRARRITLLRETLSRCRLENVSVVHVPADGGLPFRDGTFARVLVDAPCSGLGTVRRDPDIRWRRVAADLRPLAQGQLQLLRRLAPLVASGGQMVYSTCSSEPEENDEVVAAFLAEHPHFLLARWRATTPSEGLELFYGAVLVRRG